MNRLKSDLYLIMISFAFLLTVNFVIWQVVRSNFNLNVKNTFITETRAIHDELEHAVNKYTSCLNMGGALYAASQSVTRKEFEAFYKNGNCGEDDGIEKIAYVEAADSIANLEQKVKSEGGKSIYFKVYPETSATTHFVMNYIYPKEGSDKYFGYDVSADEQYAKYFLEAKEKKAIIASDINIFVDKKRLLLIKPVASQANKNGFIVLFVDPEVFFGRAIENETYSDMTMTVTGQGNKIYSNEAEEVFGTKASNLEHVDSIEVAGKTLNLNIKEPFSSRENIFQRYYPDVNLVISNLIVLLFYIFLARSRYDTADNQA